MFRWEPEGRYRHRLCTAIAPFWFSTEHLWILICNSFLALNRRVIKWLWIYIESVTGGHASKPLRKYLGSVDMSHGLYLKRPRVRIPLGIALLPHYLDSRIGLKPLVIIIIIIIIIIMYTVIKRRNCINIVAYSQAVCLRGNGGEIIQNP